MRPVPSGENANAPGALPEPESHRIGDSMTDNPTTNDTNTLPRDRASIYRLFSGLLMQEPSAEFLAQAAKLAPAIQGELGEYFTTLNGCDIERARADAASDFAALLLNMSPNPVIAYESVYTSEEGLLMQDARDDVRAQYRACGFTLDEGLSLPEDHLSFELEFMALLCEREASCEDALDAQELDKTRAAEQRFLGEHLLVWTPDFCRNLHERARCGLYRGLASSLSQFLSLEREEFDL